MKFLPAEENEDEEVCYDLGLSKWISAQSSDGKVTIWWPPSNQHSLAIKHLKDPAEGWNEYDAVVKKYYGMLILVYYCINVQVMILIYLFILSVFFSFVSR